MLRVSDHISIPDEELEFSAVRSRGAGGQNVNKVATAAQLRFDVRASGALPEDVRQRVLELRDHRISEDGVAVIKAQQYRSLERNKAAALERLRRLIERGLQPPKPRRPTRPGKAAKRRRLEQKSRRSELKKQRTRISDE